MYDLFLTLRAAALQFLVDVLPDSPIQAWLEGVSMSDSAISTGLGWLNWIFDINGCLVVMQLWLTAVAVYFGFKYGISVFGGLRDAVSNVFSTFNQMLGGE